MCFSMKMMCAAGLGIWLRPVSSATNRSNTRDRRIFQLMYPAANIHLREKNIVYPTERSENAVAFSKLAGQDIRFSMKMMFAVGP